MCQQIKRNTVESHLYDPEPHCGSKAGLSSRKARQGRQDLAPEHLPHERESRGEHAILRPAGEQEGGKATPALWRKLDFLTWTYLSCEPRKDSRMRKWLSLEKVSESKCMILHPKLGHLPRFTISVMAPVSLQGPVSGVRP